MLLLGLDESRGFAPVAVDAAKLASDLASACADQLEPPIRAEIDIVEVDGSPVVVAVIDDLPTGRKPCYLKSRGMERGAFLRTHDGDRVLGTYEIHVLVSSHSQPLDELLVVPGATIDDLEDGLVTALTRRLRATRGRLFSRATDDEILRLLGVTSDAPNGPSVTLAGLLTLGRYPQQFFPQLDVTFVAYPTITGEPLADGTRFLDNQSMDGPIPTMVDDTLAAVRRNMKRRSIVVGLGRQDRWEYPEEAVREVVANALMRRDYHPLTHGTQVRVALYPDRLEVASPGGLFGPIAREDLLAEPISSSRNARLDKLLEDVEIEGTGRTVCEKRGSGLIAAAAALRGVGIEPPELIDVVREFRVVIRNHGLLDDTGLAWLATIDTADLNDRQCLGLAFPPPPRQDHEPAVPHHHRMRRPYRHPRAHGTPATSGNSPTEEPDEHKRARRWLHPKFLFRAMTVPAVGFIWLLIGRTLRWCDIDLVNATARIEQSMCATRSARGCRHQGHQD